VVGELIAVELALVSGFGDAQNYALFPAAKTTHNGSWIDVAEVPRPDRALGRFKERILAFRASEDDRMVDLFVRLLDAMSEAIEKVVGFVGIDPPGVVDPWGGLLRVADDRHRLRRKVEVECTRAFVRQELADGE
jgi:hypothetical protein